MNHPKILPKHMTNYVKEKISGYLSFIKVGLFLLTPQGPKSKEDISVHNPPPRPQM